MNAQQLFNQPVAFRIGDRELRFRRLSALRLAAIKQASYLSKLYSDISKQMDAQQFTSPIDRMMKLRELRDAMPIGFAFYQGAEDYSDKTPPDDDVYTLLSEANADSMKADEIHEAMQSATWNQAQMVFMHVFTSKKERIWTDKMIRLLLQRLATDYGYTPADVAMLTDEQLIDLDPGLAQLEEKKLAAKAIAEQEAREKELKPEKTDG